MPTTVAIAPATMPSAWTLTTPNATATTGVATIPAAGSSDWLIDSTRPWNAAGAYRCSSVRAGTKKNAVSTPHKNTPMNATASDSVPRYRAAVAPETIIARATKRGRAMRSPITASNNPVSTSPIPKTVWSNANIASEPPSTSQTYNGSSTPNAAQSKYTQLAT